MRVIEKSKKRIACDATPGWAYRLGGREGIWVMVEDETDYLFQMMGGGGSAKVMSNHECIQVHGAFVEGYSEEREQ